MHKRTFALSLATSGAFSFVFAPRGAAACSIQHLHQRVTASSPECSRLGGETLGKSNKLIQNPELSEWVAEAGASRFPMNGEAGFPWSIRKTKSCPAGRTKSMLRMVDIQPQAGRNLQAAPADEEAPKPFRFRGFIYPGSYLLSRDLSSDYHRRADVSLPGSEWDRVGPSGYDHQVSGSSSLCCSLLTLVIICACGLLLYVLAAGWWAAG